MFKRLYRLSLPIQLVFVLIFAAIFGKYFNLTAIRFFYTISLIFKECLGFLLPFIVFSFVTTGILAFKKRAPIVLAILLTFITLSNAITSLVAYFSGIIALPILVDGMQIKENYFSSILEPFYDFKLYNPIRSEWALLFALAIGIIFSFINVPKVEFYLLKFKKLMEFVLRIFIIPLLPIFVFGFLLKINYEGVLSSLINDYGRTFILIALIQIIYLTIYYFVSSGFSFNKTIISIKNALPSYLTAFSTMSSTATIPVTLTGAIKNTGNKALSEVSIPIMANVHLVGDCISTPILSIVTMSLFLGTYPDLFSYLIFVFYFCISMLAVSGVPGGGIIVMLPILQSIFGFTPEMLSIITTLYLLQDCLGTAGNVMGDGALVILVNKFLKKINIVD